MSVTNDDMRNAITAARTSVCRRIFELHTQWQEGPPGDPALDAFAKLYEELGEPQTLDSLIKLARDGARVRRCPRAAWFG